MQRQVETGTLTDVRNTGDRTDIKSGDGVIKIGNARITHEFWRKSATHVARPGKAAKAHRCSIEIAAEKNARRQIKSNQIKR